MKPHDIASEFVVLSPQKDATPVALTPDLYQRLDIEFNDFKGHELISCYEFTGNWPTWEMHPKGDEIVVLLSGSAAFLLDIDGKQERVEMSKAGEYVVVPKGTWHTAHVSERARLLFITPGEGTENRPV